MSDTSDDSATKGARKKEYPAPSLKRYDGDYSTAGEYAAALRVWLNHYHWQCVASTFPYFLATVQAQAAAQSTLGNIPATSSGSQQQDRRAQPEATSASPPPPAAPAAEQANNTPAQPQPQPQPLPQRGVEYIIPPLSKRLIAEVVDFFLLFVIKIAVTFAAVDAFDLLSDVKKYSFKNLSADILTDYKIALEMTPEILLLELVHRIGTCVFEALCLHRGSGGAGGSTPGKKLVGLRVVRCEWVAPTGNDQAVVYPAVDLGLARAILRSVVKNFSLTFLFPVCFFLFSFQHNRTVYDMIAGSIVVEEQGNLRRRNANNAN